MAMLFAVFILTLASMTSCNGCRLEEELKCLTKKVTDQCNLDITIQSTTSPLPCDQLLSSAQVSALMSTPRLDVPKTDNLELPTKVIVLMYDIDAPEHPVNHADGWMHWVAIGTLESDGLVSVSASVAGKEYHGINPPPGAEHRYQFMIFRYERELQDINVSEQRVDQLCRFMKTNELDQPLAAGQLRYIQ